MANRFERDPSLMEMHKERMLARTRAVFDEQGKSIPDRGTIQLDNGKAALHHTKGAAYTRVEAISRVLGDSEYQYDSTSITLFDKTHRLTVASFQGEGVIIKDGDEFGNRRLLTQVKVEYGSIDEHGEVRLFNPEIKVTKPQVGIHTYHTEEKTIDWKEGLGLIIDDTEEADALTVRVYPDSKKLVFANTLNIYQKLNEAQAQLRNGGPDGK